MGERAIFKWSGEYFGFLFCGYLFDARGRYFGWVARDRSVWKKDGSYLGELVDGDYILRNSMKTEPRPKTPKFPPSERLQPIQRIDRIPLPPRSGWVDALEGL
jgi:hypothetical protein